jgi:hypothetical protein
MSKVIVILETTGTDKFAPDTTFGGYVANLDGGANVPLIANVPAVLADGTPDLDANGVQKVWAFAATFDQVSVGTGVAHISAVEQDGVTTYGTAITAPYTVVAQTVVLPIPLTATTLTQ